MVVEILNSGNFEEFVGSGNAVVDFYADWCGPCKMMEPQFKKASEKVKGIKFGKLNVDGNQDIAGRFQVMSIPTVIFFKNKEQIDRHTGALSAEDIEKKARDNF